MEDNKLNKLRRKINYCRQTSFVGVPPLFQQFAVDLHCLDLILMIFFNFVNAKVGHCCQNVLQMK